MTVPTVKVLLLGDPFVGKTSLRSQYVHHAFSSSYRATVGADYLSSKVDVGGGQQVYIQIWDTAGQERFSSLIRNFYRGADVAIFVYDITRPETFHHLQYWINQFVENVKTSRPNILIVGNKTDQPRNEHLISMRQCKEFVSGSDSYLDQYLKDVDQDVVNILAKSFEECCQLFERAARLGYENLQDNHDAQFTYDGVDITEVRGGRKGYFGGCC